MIEEMKEGNNGGENKGGGTKNIFFFLNKKIYEEGFPATETRFMQ